MIDWSSFVALAHRHQRFLFTTHVRPDADGLGSMLGLAEGFRLLGKQVRLTVASSFPPRYRFLDPEQRIEPFTPPGETFRDAEAIVVLDTGTWNQLGPFGDLMKSLPVPKAVIDHHMTQDDLGATRYVDTSAEANGRLAREALAALGVPLTPAIANPLFAAVAMDTGWFRHSNTTPATFALVGELTAAGAKPTILYEHLFETNSLGKLKLTGLVLARLQLLAEGRIAYAELHRDDYAATGAVPQDSEDLVNYPRSLAGVEIGLFFMEQPRGGVKVSFRSRARVDVAKVAERFGGGGHRLASGATLETTLADARTRVLAAVQEALAAV